MNVLDVILQNKIIVAVRNVYGEDLIRLVDAFASGGIRAAEVTFNQNDGECVKKTSEAVEMLVRKFGARGDFVIGVGTVMDGMQVKASADSGAKFIVSPNTDAEVITETKKRGLVSVPGAFTPSEIAFAHKCGADIVKLFPASLLGVRYVKDVKAPLNHIRLFASGGITEANATEYISYGCEGVFVSSFLVSKELISERNFGEIQNRARKLAVLVKK